MYSTHSNEIHASAWLLDIIIEIPLCLIHSFSRTVPLRHRCLEGGTMAMVHR